MAWHKAAAKATIHYGPRVFLTIGSILMGARIRVRPIPDAPAMTGHTLAVCASAVFLEENGAPFTFKIKCHINIQTARCVAAPDSL